MFTVLIGNGEIEMEARELSDKANALIKSQGEVEYVLRGMFEPDGYDGTKGPYVNARDLENAMKLARKKYELLLKRNLEPRELRNKLSTFLFSKGFDYELIREVRRGIIKDDYDNQ